MAAIAVVGMHRSGTSAVAGVLHRLGVFMGDDLLPPSETNPKGYFEDRRFVELHTKILGGDWKFPSQEFMHNWYMYKDEYLSLVNEFSKHELWGVKDPRLCYCLPVLRSCTQNDLKVIAMWRDPWEAAESLHARGGHEWDEAVQLSLSYMTAMLLNVEDWNVTVRLAPRPPGKVIRFDWLVGYPQDAVKYIADFIGVDYKQEAADFLDRRLVHHTEIPVDRRGMQPVAMCEYCGAYMGCYTLEEHKEICYARG